MMSLKFDCPCSFIWDSSKNKCFWFAYGDSVTKNSAKDQAEHFQLQHLNSDGELVNKWY